MKASDLYGGNWLAAEDVPVDGIRAIIIAADARKMRDQQMGSVEKLVLTFSTLTKRLVLNQTNCQFLVEEFGDDTEAWIDREIVLFRGRTRFGGKLVDCIRLRLPSGKTEKEMDL